MKHSSLHFSLPALLTTVVLTLMACARMGNPDGGWYDETPPRVIGATPREGATEVKGQRIVINFDEYIKVDNATENVVVSPPQQEMPEIKTEGRRISIKLLDKLKENTTYTVDFSSAISDNNEGNPLGNYTYTFSTGANIDTLQVAGYVLEAENLEPIKGILVGLYNNLADSAFTRLPLLRVAKTDSRGHFVIKGVAPGTYRVYALQDLDGNYMLSQRAEKLAFQTATVSPSSQPDVRQDTIWKDSLRISDIKRVQYTHFLPDDVCLRAFTQVLTDRNFLKAERTEANHFTLFYTYGDSLLPRLRGLNFETEGRLLTEWTPQRDTLTYWLKDTTLLRQDTLLVEVQHRVTDSLRTLQWRTDTLTLLSKMPYAKRMKDWQRKKEAWQKEQQKRQKKGLPTDSIMPPEPLTVEIKPSGNIDPDAEVTLHTTTPIERIDSTRFHLYAQPKGDTLWYKQPLRVERVDRHTLHFQVDWQMDMKYSLECDSAAVTDLYGLTSSPSKTGLRTRSMDEYATLSVQLQGMEKRHVVAQLLDTQGKVVKTVTTDEARADFYYVKEGSYYLKIVLDDNNNGMWDTGDYDLQQQPEEVYFMPERIDCRAKWDVTRTWNPTSTPLYRQKPAKITKQRADQKKSIQNRNAERAKSLGITYTPK